MRSGKVISGVVESFGSGEDQYCEVLDDDFTGEAQETLMGMLHSMIGKRVLITISEYPSMQQPRVSPEHQLAVFVAAALEEELRRRRAAANNGEKETS